MLLTFGVQKYFSNIVLLTFLTFWLLTCQAPRSSPLGLACELDPSSSCLVMYFDKVDANMMNLAHELSERGAADTCIGHLRHQSASENNALYLNI